MSLCQYATTARDSNVRVTAIRYDDGDFALRFGEFEHCYQTYMSEQQFRSLISAMQRTLPVDPDEEARYYSDSEL